MQGEQIEEIGILFQLLKAKSTFQRKIQISVADWYLNFEGLEVGSENRLWKGTKVYDSKILDVPL